VVPIWLPRKGLLLEPQGIDGGPFFAAVRGRAAGFHSKKSPPIVLDLLDFFELNLFDSFELKFLSWRSTFESFYSYAKNNQLRTGADKGNPTV